VSRARWLVGEGLLCNLIHLCHKGLSGISVGPTCVRRDELKLVTKGTNGGASTSQAFPSYLDLHVNEELAY
jgi:hypothetical protein